jgi:hypothetical protein
MRHWRGPGQETGKVAPVLAEGMGAGGGAVDRGSERGVGGRRGSSAWRARESWGVEDKEREGKQVVHAHFRGHRANEVYMCRLFVSNRLARISERPSPLDKTWTQSI